MNYYLNKGNNIENAEEMNEALRLPLVYVDSIAQLLR
jgi:hypothetical protein